MTIQSIIDKIEKAHNAVMDPNARTCDGVIAGDASKECTGVAVTCCPTAEVIKKAAEKGCNFIYCHEPTYFDGFDETDWLAGNTVYEAKKALIEKTGVTIYRDHDHMHMSYPDGIFIGVIRKLGWEGYFRGDRFSGVSMYELPPTTVGGIARHLAEVMRVDGMRVVGDPDMEVTRVGNTFHYSGGPMDRKGIEFIEENDIQVILTGEIVDWTIVEYVHDAIALGKKRALLNPGHFNWEEPGMEYAAEHLPEIIGGDVPVRFIQSGNVYRWLEK